MQAVLIDADRNVNDAQHDVCPELAMSFGVEAVGTWGPSERPGFWRANLRPIAQPD